MPFVADELGAWLIGVLADAGRKRLTDFLLGTDQERALRRAAAVAVELTARELRPEDTGEAEELAMVVSEVFNEPVPGAPPELQATVLEALRDGIGRQLAVLDDISRTGAGQSSAEILGLSTSLLTEKLSGHLVRQIVVQGSRGGPLQPLAAQLNHDVTHLQVHQLARMFGQLSEQVAAALARFEAGPGLPTALTVRYSLPPDAAQFTGREEELNLVRSAVAGARTGSIIGIHAIGGMPGIGKTALAVHAAHLFRNQFADWQLYLNLHAHTPGQDPVPPESALAGLLRAIGIDPRHIPKSLAERTALWRDRMAGQRALLVLDNAASSAQVEPLLPSSDGCLVLVTSRRELGDLPGEVVPIRLQVLHPAEAQEMFVRLAVRPDVGTPDMVAELVQAVGYLPLAISLLAHVYARHTSWTMTDLITETRTRMLSLKAENASVGAAFEVSYRYLPKTQREFFRRLALHLGATTDAHAAAALTGTSVESAGESLDSLYREGLLTEAGYHRYGMHDLIRRYARDRSAGEPTVRSQQAVDRLLDYYQYTAALAESLLAQKTVDGRLGLMATPASAPQLPDSNQALAWARIERANLAACLDHATRTGQYARVVSFTAAMAALLRRDGPWAEAIDRHSSAARIAERLGERSEQARALTNLAVVRRLTGDYPGAARALEEALGICRGLGDRSGLASALSELGAVRYLTDDCPAAIQDLQEALTISRELGDRAGQAYALTYTGIVQQVTGDYSSAVSALEEALAISRDLGDRLGQASALSELGAVRQVTGDYPGAAAALEEALGISRDLGDRLGEAYALIYLGVVRRLIGDYRGAAQVLEEALTNARETDHQVGQVGPLTYLGAVRQDLGDYPGAEQALEEALTICRALGDRLGLAYALSFKGRLCRLTGDYAEAENSLERALNISRELGAQDSEITALNETGMLRRDRGNLAEAREFYLAALNLARQTSSSWEEAQALAGLGRCALAVGRAAEAKTSLQRAQQIFERIGAAEAAHISAELDTISATPPAQES